MGEWTRMGVTPGRNTVCLTQAFQTYETDMSEEKKNIREAIKIE